MSSSSSPSPVGNPQDREPIVVVLAVALVLLLVLAAVAFRSANIASPTPPPQPPKNDGPTLYQAIAGVNQSLRNVSGGPWGLFSIYGVAAQAPFSADVISYPLNNQTANACQAQFNGLTLWNGTIPVFTGTLNSGTAPFWQFGFYSNVTQQIVLATNVEGSVHIYPPMSANGSCHPWYDLGSNPGTWVKQLAPFLPNSPAIAQSAMTQVGNLSWFYPSSPWAEIYTTGPGVFVGFGDLEGFAGVILERCGLLGVSNLQSVLPWAENLNGTDGGYSNETGNCAVLNYPYFAGYGSYDLVPGPANTSVTTGALQLSLSYQVGIVEHNQTAPYVFDGWGLANWMTSWNLTNASGEHLPLAVPGCREWVSTVADCAANALGWYAVVLSASGGWLDSYGVLPGGGVGWSEPVTALVSHEQLVVVCPNSWNVTGDVLNVTSTVPTSTVNGSFNL
jgi:hypothetical protein